MNTRFLQIALLLLIIFNNDAFSATITSAQSGNWSNNNTWDCSCVPGAGDNVVIAATHIVTVNQDATITDLDIALGAIVTSNGRTLTLTGNIMFDGVITGSLDLIISGTNTIDGSGVISTTGTITLTGGNKTIQAAVDEVVQSVVIIDVGVTVTNNGNWITASEIIGNAASSTWVQGAGSSLRTGDILLTTGTLDASGAGNTIEYFNGIQAIKTATGAYHNLVLSGSGDKDLAAAIDINGDLDILSGTFDPNNFNVNIAGNWTNAGGYTQGTGSVIFDGTSNSTISVAGGEIFYDLTTNKPGFTLFLADDVDVTNTLTLTAGGINGNGNKITVGSSTANIGTIAGPTFFYNGQFKKWVNATGTYYSIPLRDQTGSLSTVIDIRFDNLTSGAITVEFVNAAPGIAGFTLDDAGTTVYNTFSEGYWDVSTSDLLATTQFDIRLKADDFTSFTPPPTVTTQRIVSRANPAGNWGLEGVHQAAGVVKARRRDLATIDGNFAVADITNCTAPTTPVITGDNTVCNNDMDIPYSVVDNGDTYNWTIVGGVQDTGGTTNSITVDWGAVGGPGSVAVVAVNGCTSTFPVTLPVEIGPLPTSSPPSGKANVADLTLGEPYSVVNNAGYTYTWLITGGTVATGQTTSSITVDWGAAGAGNVNIISSNACGSAAPVDYPVNIYEVIESAQSGNYTNNNTWTCSCEPLASESFRVLATHTVVLNGAAKTITNALVDAGGDLDLNNDLIVTEDLDMNGIVDGTGDVTLSGNGKLIDGSGLFQNTGDIIITGGGKTIVSSAGLSKSNGDVTIDNDITVTNNGVFTLNGSLIGGNANSRFINEANSTLSVSATLLSTGTLISSANGNTVNYTGLVDQTIFPTTYYDLGASGDGIKSLSANTDINDELQISDDARLDVTASDFTITLGGDWTNTSTDADPFLERTSTVTFDGSTLQTLTATLASGETFNDFVINNAAGATLNDPLTIASSITLSNGIINTSTGNELIIADNATATVATDFSYVDGPMDKIGDDAFVFPVGDGGNYQAIEISAPGATSDRFQAQYFQTAHPDQINMDITLDHVSALEYWDLSLIAGTPTVNVTLHWDSYSVVSAVAGERNDLRAAHYLTGNWTDEGNDGITGDETGGTIVVNGISTFSPWTLASISSNNPLPITLIDFYAVQYDEFLELHWSTADETNNDYFTIEKSSEFAADFMPIGKIAGKGNSTSKNHYSFQDTFPKPGFNYYRLKQTDFSGEYTYSNIIVVQADDFSKLVLYPNPSQGILNIKVPKMGGTRTLKIFDQFGAQIVSKVLKNREDHITIYSGFDEGLYIVRITDGFQSFNQKFIVNK